MSAIPDREWGYSVEASTVHERYQDHAPLARRTSAKGVANILAGRIGVPCPTCFPAPKARGWLPNINGQHGGEVSVPVVKEPEAE